MDMNQLLRALGLQQAYQAYQQNIGQPFANVAGPFGRGLLGLDKPEYGEEQAYRTGQAVGNMPAVSAPVGLLKAAAQTPEMLGLIGSVVGGKKIGNVFDMLTSGRGYEFDEAGELVFKPKTTVAIGDPNDFQLIRESNGNKLNVSVKKDDGFYGANYYVDPGFPKGTGQLSNMYLEALSVAQKDGSGWVSDTIRSNETNKLYNRLIEAGVPFKKTTQGQYFLEADILKDIDLEKIIGKLEARNQR
jgi:hypothetical protein